MYDLQIDEIRKRVEEKNYKSILIQMPEGMLDEPLQNILDHLSKHVQIFISGDPSFGVCDLAVDLAEKMNCDMLVHFGHSDFGFQHRVKEARNRSIEVMLVPAYFNPLTPLNFSSIKSKLDNLDWKTVQLSATVQHLRSLEKLQSFLEEEGFNTIINNTGQILGCNINNLKVHSESTDGLVSLYAGFFHTHGIMLNSDKILLQFDPYSEEMILHDISERNHILQQRFTLLEKAKKASRWGIIGSSKLGQYNSRMIVRMEELLKKDDKIPTIVVAENINPQNMANFHWIDAWVVTACPRIAIDDKIRYSSPVITFREFLHLAKEISWDDLLKDGFF
ncbi:MAG: diphthamide biosynthesis enzyme Dph2 [Candidatus Hodarchaeales archaeon]